ncbi:MAG: hypothetical protein R3183_11105 [Oleiphilaceae bacterium]|nr:hypothetical protein [Oleiphilaceae bacterium]
MPYSLTWSDRGVDVTFSGLISASDILQSGIELRESERFARCRYQVFNFAPADLSKLDLASLRDIAFEDTQTSLAQPEPALAIVSTSAIADALAFHYKQMAEHYKMTWPVVLFSTVKEARAWTNTL